MRRDRSGERRRWKLDDGPRNKMHDEQYGVYGLIRISADQYESGIRRLIGGIVCFCNFA